MGQFDEVEVRSRFLGGWARGFELDEADLTAEEPRFKVRCRSDGAVLPEWFSADEIRPIQSPREPVH